MLTNQEIMAMALTTVDHFIYQGKKLSFENSEFILENGVDTTRGKYWVEATPDNEFKIVTEPDIGQMFIALSLDFS